MERGTALKNIAQNDKCTAIVVSILAGGVGKSIIHCSNNEIRVYLLSLLQDLNITACNTVVILEPWWSPYIEVTPQKA
jgi:SNF2 family DNA or RNA helicase